MPRKDPRALLLEHLANNPSGISTEGLAEATGLHRDTARRNLRRMEVEGATSRSPRTVDGVVIDIWKVVGGARMRTEAAQWPPSGFEAASREVPVPAAAGLPAGKLALAQRLVELLEEEQAILAKLQGGSDV